MGAGTLDCVFQADLTLVIMVAFPTVISVDLRPWAAEVNPAKGFLKTTDLNRFDIL